jgi:integrase
MRDLRDAWNKGRLLGQKPPLKPKEIWSIRIRLQLANRARDLALFNLALDSKLRGCDLTSLRVRDVFLGGTVASRASYGTHSLRRTKATLIYKRTKNIRAIQLLLGHSKLESTVRYLGVEVDDALEISEQVEI